MSRPDGDLLVIGIGNILLRDDGVGVRVVHDLEALAASDAAALPAGTRLLDGGTLGLDLLPAIDDARALLLIDAVDFDRPAGTVGVVRGDAIGGALTGRVSPHQVGIGDVVSAARLLGRLPAAVSLVGIQPDVTTIGLDLSAPVEAALPDAMRVARAELVRLSSGRA